MSASLNLSSMSLLLSVPLVTSNPHEHLCTSNYASTETETIRRKLIIAALNIL